jgi:hypothetical protein
MDSLYNHELHITYQHRINNEINIKDKIFQAIETFMSLGTDITEYPHDQDSLYNLCFPFANQRSFPASQLSDYVACLNNYRTNGYLFTIRYLHPIEKYSEVLFLNPNEEGQVWILIIGPELGEIEQVKKESRINLSTDIIEGIYY